MVEQNYGQMIKYATAIRQGTASTEAILRHFTRSASHPTYQAMLEVGRAQRTIFVARYLRSRELQREITEGLNVVEAFNGANSVIYYGKGGEIASNRHDEQEMTVQTRHDRPASTSAPPRLPKTVSDPVAGSTLLEVAWPLVAIVRRLCDRSLPGVCIGWARFRAYA